MQSLQLTKQSILVSQGLVASLKEVPYISEIKVEFIPNNQNLESMFSDSMHMIQTSKGLIPKYETVKVGQKVETRMYQEVNKSNMGVILKWRSGLNVESPIVYYESSDEMVCNVTWSSLRTYLLSQIENEIKYRLGIQEFYMDKVSVVLKLKLNKDSSKYSSVRETLLRITYLPIRIVERLVK